jgi:hypothetical protein
VQAGVVAAACVTCHTSHVTRYTSHVTRHTSCVTRHTSCVTRHTSHVTRHTSHVTRHTSHVTRHTSPLGLAAAITAQRAERVATMPDERFQCFVASGLGLCC